MSNLLVTWPDNVGFIWENLLTADVNYTVVYRPRILRATALFN